MPTTPTRTDFDSTRDGRPTQNNIVLHALRNAGDAGRSIYGLVYEVERATRASAVPEPSIRRAIQTLRKNHGYRIDSVNGAYVLRS